LSSLDHLLGQHHKIFSPRRAEGKLYEPRHVLLFAM
jgi:hypothetical protein